MLLIVKEKDLHLAKNLEIAPFLLAAGRQIWPETTAVLPVSGSLFQHVKDNTLQVADVRIESKGQ